VVFRIEQNCTHGSLDSIAHRPTRAQTYDHLCECAHSCTHTTGIRIHQEARVVVSQALDYSYAIHQPVFMVKACVLTATSSYVRVCVSDACIHTRRACRVVDLANATMRKDQMMMELISSDRIDDDLIICTITLLIDLLLIVYCIMLVSYCYHTWYY